MLYPGFKRTRLAPTPSGYLHLGNVFSFVVATGLAIKYGARVLLRIDDMDRERVRDAYVQDIFDTLDFLEIPWDEGPRNKQEFEQSFSQLHRIPFYKNALDQLKQSHQVFACDCTRLQVAAGHSGPGYPGTCVSRNLPLDAQGVQWRLHTESCQQVSYRDLLQGNCSAPLPASVRYAAVRRRDGKPAYQLCSLVDDLHFQVDLVVRGEDLFASSLLQSCLSELLPARRFHEVVFFHHPLLTEAGLKMSKSEGATSVQYLRRQGLNRAEVYKRLAVAAGLEPDATDHRALFAMLAGPLGLA